MRRHAEAVGVLQAGHDPRVWAARGAPLTSRPARGRALQDSPGLVQLQIVEKWNGVTPLVVGNGGSGANILLPISGK